VLLAIAKVETDPGQAHNGQPDDLAPADIRADVDVAALRPGGSTATMLGLKDGRRSETGSTRSRPTGSMRWA